MVRSKFFETAMLYLIKNVQVKFPNGANSWETESPNPNDARVAKTKQLNWVRGMAILYPQSIRATLANCVCL